MNRLSSTISSTRMFFRDISKSLESAIGDTHAIDIGLFIKSQDSAVVSDVERIWKGGLVPVVKLLVDTGI